MHLVDTVPLAAVQLAFGTRLCTDPHNQVSIYTQRKTFRQRRAIFKVRLLCGTYLCFFQRGPQKSTLRCGFVYNYVENARFKAVFPLPSPNTEQTISLVAVL